MQIAIAIGVGLNNINWCEVEGTNEHGATTFYVINGAYRGSILSGVLKIDPREGRENWIGPNKLIRGRIVWQGKAPFSYDDYNSAIPWIRTQALESGERIRDYIIVNDGIFFDKEEILEIEEDYDDIPF